MDENIKNSVNARKIAFTSAYEINNDIEKEINALFEQIENFALTCHDVMDFETKFATSPLNTEYINLFTKIATTCKPITYESDNDVKSDAEYVKDEVLSDLKYTADEIARPVRRKVKGAIYDKMRDIPVIKDVMLAKQYKDLGESLVPNKKEEDIDDWNKKCN